jgi:hypothetical protein
VPLGGTGKKQGLCGIGPSQPVTQLRKYADRVTKILQAGGVFVHHFFIGQFISIML